MKKALLVDDDYLVRSYLKMLTSWQKAGIEIAADVRDGEEALERLEQGGIDLVITDLAMPLMDGIELICEIRKRYQDLYVIVLSCHDEFDYVKKALQEGADEYVLKNTLNEETLYKLLKETMEKLAAKEPRKTEKSTAASSDGTEPEAKREESGNQKFLFFNQILAGTLTGEEREKKRIEAGIRAKFQNSAVIVIKLDESENAEDPWDDIRREQYCLDFFPRLCQKLQSTAAELGAENEIIYLGRGSFCCFVDLSDLYRNSMMYQRLMHLASACYKICRQEEKEYKIGVSNIGIGAEALRQGYQQARMMIKVGFYEEDPIIYYTPEKVVGRQLPAEAGLLLESREKLCRGGQKELFLRMCTQAIEAFQEQMTDSVLIVQWLHKMEQMMELEEKLELQELRTIRDVTEAVRQIAEHKYRQEQIQLPEHVSKAVRTAAEYAAVHYRESIGLNDAAEAAGVNSTYLSYLFGQEMGIGYSNYILNLRIRCAQRLLRETNLKIRQVAEQAGFHDYHYFSKVFKKSTGMSAAQYRSEVERLCGS